MLYGIDVIVIGPGAIATPIWDKAEENDLARFNNTPYGPASQRSRITCSSRAARACRPRTWASDLERADDREAESALRHSAQRIHGSHAAEHDDRRARLIAMSPSVWASPLQNERAPRAGEREPAPAALLAQIGVTPDAVIAADIDETPLRKKRRACCAASRARAKRRRWTRRTRLCLPPIPWSRWAAAFCRKPETRREARACLALLSGRNSHRVFTGVAVKSPRPHAHADRETQSTVQTSCRSRDRSLHRQRRMAGQSRGYAIQGRPRACDRHRRLLFHHCWPAAL